MVVILGIDLVKNVIKVFVKGVVFIFSSKINEKVRKIKYKMRVIFNIKMYNFFWIGMSFLYVMLKSFFGIFSVLILLLFFKLIGFGSFFFVGIWRDFL